MRQHTFLVEIGTEELPPKLLRSLGEDFAFQISAELDMASIFHGKVSWFAAPRRLAVKSVDLNSVQENHYIKRRGPAVIRAFEANGTPTKEAKCWARDCGITVSQANFLSTEKGKWLLHQECVKGKPVQVLLGDIVNRALKKLLILKMMRWSDNDVYFIRPVHTVTMLLDDRIISGKVLGVEANRILFGHRFMGEPKITLEHADLYSEILLARGQVMVDYFQRKEIIRKGVEEVAKQLGGTADLTDTLLEEVTSLVEWPVVLSGRFEEKFLTIPVEALVYTMKCKQRYFPVYDLSGNLLSYFIFVSNIESKNSPQVILGNERVLRSRLADAEFFFNIDRKQRLEDRLPHLETVLFQRQLGSLRDKANRMEFLSKWIGGQIGADIAQAARAGLLSKCDLITEMVFQFPEIQGVMGMYYARYDGESELVALAQKEQYYPRFSGDKLPTTFVSCALAIAEKIDMLVGMFGVRQNPKRDQDPFALRRAALGLLRIIVEKKLILDLKILMEKAASLYGNKLTNNLVVNDVFEFILCRFRVWYQDQGYSIDTIQAVFACRSTHPVDIDARMCALNHFRTLKESETLLVVNKRIINILSKSNEIVFTDLKDLQFYDSREIILANSLEKLREKLQPMFENRHYRDILAELVVFCELVDTFLNNTKILAVDDQVRINRLTLLDQSHRLFLQVADFSLLQQM